MAAGGSQEGIESFLTCSICMEPFSRPKILPCVHSFCCQCLKSYLSSGAANRKKGGFPCPTCRQHVPVAKPSKAPETWPDQLKDNFVMSSMLEALNQQKSAALSPSSRATSPKTSGTSPPAGGSSVAQSGTPGCTCRSAPEVVCWDCAVFVCSHCSASAHADCSQVQKISTAGPEKRQEMLEWLPQLNDRLADLERRQASAQASLLSVQCRHQATQDQVTQAARDATLMVQLQEKKLRQTMDKEFEVILRHHQQHQKASSVAVDNLKALKEALEQCVLERDVELLRQAQCLQQRYNAVTAPAPEGTLEDGEDEDQDLEPGTFVATSLTRLKSMVLVGVYHSGLDQSPVTSAPTSPSTSDSSWCFLPDGPVLHHRPRCHSLPADPTLHPSPVEADSSEGQTTTDEGTAPCTLSSPMLLSGQRAVTCHHTSKFSARAKGDKVEALIRDLAALGNGWLVATDIANRCVKCYFKANPGDGKFQCKRLVLPQPPYGVCSVEGHLVAVTVPKERQLLMVMARPHLVLLTTLTLPAQTQEAAWAVSSFGEQRLAVTTCPQGDVGSVLILQVTGDSVQIVARYSSLVTTPLYIAVTTDYHIVITDPTSCHVACISSDSGHAVFHYHTNGKVMSVTCHPKLLVVVDQSPALTLLTPEGSCVHTLPLPRVKAGCSQPRAVALATDSAIWVSDDSGKLHLFRLGWQEPPPAADT